MMSFLGFLVLIIVSTAETSQTVSKNTTLFTEYKEVFIKYQAVMDATNRTLYGIDFPMRPILPTISQLLMSTWVVGMKTCSFTNYNPRFKVS